MYESNKLNLQLFPQSNKNDGTRGKLFTSLQYEIICIVAVTYLL